MKLWRKAPERVARNVLVSLVTAAAFAPLLALAPKSAWWQSPPFAAALLLLGGLASLRGEASPELADTWCSERAQRFSPLAIGLLFPISLLFPTLGTWYLLWLLFWVNAALLPWTYLPRVRTVSLCVSSAAALGLTVVNDAATWSLGAIALGWLLVPSLDRLGNTRLRQLQRPAPTLWPALAPASALLALGLLTFTALSALLPTTTRAYEVIDLLTPRQGLKASASTAIELPSLELFGLLVLVVALLAAVSQLSAGASADKARLHDEGGMRAEGARPLAAAARGIAPLSWPRGSRRDLVEAYLEHLERLEALGYPRASDTTPADLATRVAGALPATSAAASRRLAERFGRARWARGAVAASAAREAIEDARTVEEALARRADEAS